MLARSGPQYLVTLTYRRNFCVTVCRKQGNDMAGNRKMHGAGRVSLHVRESLMILLAMVTRMIRASLRIRWNGAPATEVLAVRHPGKQPDGLGQSRVAKGLISGAANRTRSIIHL